MNYAALETALSKIKDKSELFETVVNLPLEHKLHATKLGLGIVVLLLVNEKSSTLDRIALSNNELATGAVRMSAKPFHEIKIPLNYRQNLLVEAVHSKKHQQTNDWQYMFNPVLTPQEARFNQAGAGIDCSVIYPLIAEENGEALGALIFSYFEPLSKITKDHHEFMKTYSSMVAAALSRR